MTDRRAIAGPDTNLNWPEASARTVEIERTRIKLPAETDRRSAVLRDPLSARSSAFRVLRHRVARSGDPRVIMVTSANDEEGKTTCALNLALVLAESGRNRVLLLEANTRRPALTAVLGFSTPACVLDQLTQHRGDAARPWKVAQLSSHDLDVLAVQPRSEPRLPLHAPSLLAATNNLRQVYDYIVIDTSSILTGLDVPLAQDAADGIVLAAKTRHSRARSMNAALDQIGTDRILGVALIDP